MLDLLAEHASVLIAVFVLLSVATVLTARWESFSLWLLGAWHALPVFGGIAWMARRQAPRAGGAHMHSDRSAQLALCSSYARYIRVVSRADYDNYMNYLRKAGDLGRRPFPTLLWFVVFSMVMVEAAGFAYVLAGWTLPGASEVLQQLAAGGIGLLIAVILVFFTHWAGVEIYQSNQHQRDRKEWISAGKPGPLYGPDLSLNDPQTVDDHEPAYRQRSTRGHGKTTYLLTVVTLVMVVAIGGGAAYVRGQVLEQELVLEAANRAKAMDRFDLSLPDAAMRERIAIDRQALADEIAIKRRGGWGTLVVLMTIFFFLQLLGMFFGYRYSFNGRLSRDAYRALYADRFSSYSELVQYYDRIADIAQSRLEILQQAIARRRAGSLGLPAQPYGFRDYLQEREAQRRDKPLGGEIPGPAAAMRPATVPAANGAENAADAAANAAAPAVKPPAPATASVEPAPKPSATRAAADTGHAIPDYLTLRTMQPQALALQAEPPQVQRRTEATPPAPQLQARSEAKPTEPASVRKSAAEAALDSTRAAIASAIAPTIAPAAGIDAALPAFEDPRKLLEDAEALERRRAAERAAARAARTGRPATSRPRGPKKESEAG